MKWRSWGRTRWALVGLLLLAWALRLPPMLDTSLHPDEALYGYWGLLIGRGRDPWLATVPVYKPPLLPYLVAVNQALLGGGELAVRFVGLTAGLLTVPLTAALAWVLYRDRWTAGAAAVAVGLSPFAIALSGTAFPDPPMVALGLAACLAAARDRPGWAGLLAGLSFATKQTGLVWTPLAVLCARVQVCKRVSVQVRRVVSLEALAVGLVFAWDALRVARGAESFWHVGVAGYGGLRLIWPHELWTRLREWIELARCLFISPIVNVVLAVGLLVLVWSGIRRPSSILHRRRSEVPDLHLGRYTRGSFVDLLLVSFSLIYFLLHWLIAFPIWDRYLLPLVPILSLLLARALTLLASCVRSTVRHSSFAIRHWIPIICHVSLVICLIWPALNSALGRYAIGDRAAYGGIDRVTAFLSGLPEGSVVYHHWLGWHFHYYLFDAPVYLAYWPTPAWLARDVRAFGGREPRYVTFPSWESSARVERALSGVGYGLAPVLTAARRDGRPSFTVYHVERIQDGSE